MHRWPAVVLMLLMTATAAADAGLDLTLVLDRSTSMARRSRSDHELLRMTLDLLARHADANRVEHRLAVIGFGSTASVDMPFTRVRQDELPGLFARIDGLRFQDRGDTDVLAAFAIAENLFRALPVQPERRRAVVLVTDGVPYVRGADMNAYHAHLRDFVTAHLARESITVDVLLLDSRDRGLWSQIARVEPVESAADRLLPAVHGVIARLVGTRTAESAPAKAHPAVDTLVVPPYLELIVFDIFRGASDAEVAIVAPGGVTPIRGGVDGVEAVPVGDVLTTLAVPHPAPGEWIVRKSRTEARVRVLSQQFFPRGSLLQPSEMDVVRRCSQVLLAYRVLDGSGNPLHELREYALALEVTLVRPDGVSAAVAMERDAALGAGTFRSAQDPLCEREGRYWTDVRVTTVDATGHRLEVFRDRWSGFSVAASTEAECRTARATVPMPKRRGASHTMIWIVSMFLALGCVAVWLVRRKTDS